MRDERINVIPRRRSQPPRVGGAAGPRVGPGAGMPRPALTARDAAALRFVGEQYAVTR